MLNNIPQELKALPQWAVAGPLREPLDPKTGKRASVNDPESWGSYEQAIARARGGHIGFILSHTDPYTIIDMDNKIDKPLSEEQKARHSAVLNAIDSYTETSMSGRGLHIVVKANIPRGVNRDYLEVSSSARFMIFTGKVFKDRPINDYQEMLTSMFHQMGGVEQSDLIEQEDVLSDNQLFEMAFYAANGAKFDRLCRGDIAEYPSQSEADLALLSIIAYYTKDNEQVRRLFRYSELGEREKAHKDNVYLDYALRRIRAKQPPAVDVTTLDGIPLTPDTPLPPVPVSRPKLPAAPRLPAFKLTFPSGLVGDIARYTMATAYRPVPEISLMAALGLMGGVAGRAYNISGTGLNQYLVLLAGTGTGKEGMAKATDKLMTAVKDQIPSASTFIGPGAFASGQALGKRLAIQPCFYSILGEFGLTLKAMTGPKASSSEQMMKKVLLDLYNKSGENDMLQSTVYSDAEKSIDPIRAPSLTILGESTPSQFYNALGREQVEMGLIPRFTVLEYHGKRNPLNPNAGCPPAEGLVDRLCNVVQASLQLADNSTCCRIAIDEEAQGVLDLFNLEIDAIVNANEADEVLKQLWNRAHLKALKLSGLIAVGVNHLQPTVTKEHADWSIEFTRHEITTILGRFSEGDVGDGPARQDSDLRRAFKKWVAMTPAQRVKHKACPAISVRSNVVPYSYLSATLRRLSSFTGGNTSGTLALKHAIADMVDTGELSQIPPMTALQDYKVSTPLYYMRWMA